MREGFVEEDVDAEVPDVEFKPIPTKELDRQAQSQMKEFGNLLNSLDKSLDKKKQLWKQIYDNAVTDRKLAYLVFANLYIKVHQNHNEHAIHGPTLSKYLERMGKATDQLIKLAELVASAEECSSNSKVEEESEEDIYSSIQSKKARH